MALPVLTGLAGPPLAACGTPDGPGGGVVGGLSRPPLGWYTRSVAALSTVRIVAGLAILVAFALLNVYGLLRVPSFSRCLSVKELHRPDSVAFDQDAIGPFYRRYQPSGIQTPDLFDIQRLGRRRAGSDGLLPEPTADRLPVGEVYDDPPRFSASEDIIPWPLSLGAGEPVLFAPPVEQSEHDAKAQRSDEEQHHQVPAAGSSQPIVGVRRREGRLQ